MIFNSMVLTGFYIAQLAAGKQLQLRREIRGARAIVNVPTLTHRDLYVFPWLLSDSCWALANHSAAIGQPCRFLSAAGIALGVCALAVCGHELRRQVAMLPWHEVNHIVAEFTWVLGNVVWFSADALELDSDFEKFLVIITFLLGLLMLLAGELKADQANCANERLLPSIV